MNRDLEDVDRDNEFQMQDIDNIKNKSINLEDKPLLDEFLSKDEEEIIETKEVTQVQEKEEVGMKRLKISNQNENFGDNQS